jgi:hypothetical protein
MNIHFVQIEIDWILFIEGIELNDIKY